MIYFGSRLGNSRTLYNRITLTMESMTLPTKPSVTIKQVRAFLLKKWNYLQVKEIDELQSYEYRTYLVNTENKKYIFKIFSENEYLNESFFEALEEVLTFLEVKQVLAQRMVRSSDEDKFIHIFTSEYYGAEQKNPPLKAFLLTYIEGQLLINMEITPKLCFDVGRELNKLTSTVDEIQPRPRFLRDPPLGNVWKLDNVAFIKTLIPYMETSHQQHLLTKALNRFEETVRPKLRKLTKGFIHGDPNESNIIIGEENKICFIDWVDIGYSYKVYDLAILIFSVALVGYNCQFSLNMEDIGIYCLQGYIDDKTSCLTEDDIELLANIIEARISVSLAIGQYTYTHISPGNEYILNSAKHGWTLLENLLIKRDEYNKIWRLTLNNNVSV